MRDTVAQPFWCYLANGRESTSCFFLLPLATCERAWGWLAVNSVTGVHTCSQQTHTQTRIQREPDQDVAGGSAEAEQHCVHYGGGRRQGSGRVRVMLMKRTGHRLAATIHTTR